MLDGTDSQRLLPKATSADAGKVPTVQSSGAYLLETPEGGGIAGTELLDAHRGLTIAQTDRPIIQPLSAFTTPYTTSSTHHGVIFVSIQANVAAGSTSQLALGGSTTSTTQVFLGVLQDSSDYDGSPGNAGNGVEVAEFIVNNTSGVKQGEINCYIAHNASDQVGTYATYTADAGASNNLAGSIQMRWEVTLFRTDQRTATSGARVTDTHIAEVARDNVAAALQRGDNEATADIEFSHNDLANSISARIKTGAIVPADVKRDTTDATKASDLTTWQTLFGISATTPTEPVVPQPVTLPALFITRDAADPADVVTIRDTRGFLNETLPVGTTLNLWHGGTATAQTAVAGSPWTIRNRISGGLRQTTQRVQLNKALGFTTSAVPITINTFNADAYYVTIGVRGTISLNVGDYHSYDAAESFTTQNTGGRGVNYNSVRNIISVIDGGSPKRHYGYTPGGGGTPVAVYTQTLEGDPYGCAWDPDGRHLYVHEGDSSFKVYDFGASNTPTTLTISRVTSKEFDVSTWFSIIDGIQVTATEVIILGRRFNRSPNRAIDKFSKTGVRNTAASDIYVSGSFGGAGVLSNSTFTQTWSAAVDGDHIDSMAHTTAATNLRHSLGVVWGFRSTPSTQDSTIIGNTLYLAHGNSSLGRYDLQTGDIQTDTNTISASSFVSVTSAGSWLYGMTRESPVKIYRSNRAVGQSNAWVQLTGVTGSNWERLYWSSSYPARMIILNNTLYILLSGTGNNSSLLAVQSAPLTGSVSAGYTAVGTATRTTVNIGWTHNSNGYDLFRGFATDGTSIYATITRGIDDTSDRGLARYNTSSGDMTVFTRYRAGGTTIVWDSDRSVFQVWSSSNGSAYDFTSIQAKTAVRERNRTFPLGVRQGDTHGFGYNATQDEFYVGNTNQINIYDKSQPTGLIRWQPNEALDIRVSHNSGRMFFISGNRFYSISPSYIDQYEYPVYNFIQRVNRASGSQGYMFEHNNLLYDFSGSATIRQFSPANGEWIGANITLQNFNWTGANPVVVNNVLRIHDHGRNIIRAYPLPATGAITAGTTLNETTSSRITNVSRNVTSGGGLFFYNSRLWACNGNRSPISFYKYNLTTNAQDGDAETVTYRSGGQGSGLPYMLSNILYRYSSDRYYGYVRIV